MVPIMSGHPKHKSKQKRAKSRGGMQKTHNDSYRNRSKPKSKLKIDLFGFHAVAEAWLNPSRDIHALYITQNALDGFETIQAQADNSNLKRPSPIVVEKHEIENCLPKGSVHQGIALSTAPLSVLGLPDLLIKTQTQDSALILILDQVTDPHNVGAITRSACAFGADGILTQSRHTPDLTGVLAKTACGALEHVPFAAETNLSRAIEELQDNHFIILGLDERGDINIDEAAKRHRSDKIALVLGAEGPGIRRLVKEKCDFLVRLPMEGPMPSINVSNAAAVALYAIAVDKTC